MASILIGLKYLVKLGLGRIKLNEQDHNQGKPQEADTKGWIINGKVYDLSPFLHTHPGGEHILRLNYGRDCTELFFSYHITSQFNIDRLLARLDKHYVADAHSKSIKTPFDWNGRNMEMFLDLQSRVRAHFKKAAPFSGAAYSRKAIKASNLRLAWYALLFISYFWSFSLSLSGCWLSLPMMTLVHWLLSTDLLHNGTHYEIFVDPKWNLRFGALGCYHAPAMEWEMQHVISHHSYTNIHELDVDLNHFLDNFRTSALQSYVAKYRQWRYFLPIYFAGASSGQIDSWARRAERNIHRDIPFWRSLQRADPYLKWHCAQIGWTMFAMPALFFITFGLADAWKAFVFLLIPRIGHGMLFYLFSQISHIQTNAFCAGDEVQSKSWIEHQIRSSVDYSVDSTFWNLMSVGLNSQTVHHLLPAVHPCHFAALQPVLDGFCEKYGIKRRVHANVCDIFCSHLEHLALVNDSPRGVCDHNKNNTLLDRNLDEQKS